MPALCSMLWYAYYAYSYAGIIGPSLKRMVVLTDKSLLHSLFDLYSMEKSMAAYQMLQGAA